MDPVSLGVPRPLLESLPEDGHNAAEDMQRAVGGLEQRLNRGIEAAETDAEAASHVLRIIEHMEARGERYDDFVPELRAWGQSPIYAIAWRNLYADLIAQLYENEELAGHLDRERNQRLVEDGIRFGNAKKD
jgi:hypothetical protein